MSHIEIKLVADTASDLSALVAGLHQQLSGEVVIGTIAADVDDHVGNDPELEKSKPVASATRTSTKAPATSAERPVAEKSTASASEGNAGTKSTTTASEAGASAEPIAYADVQKATNALVVKKGRDAALEVLGTFGAKKGQDLTEDQWAAYIEACSLAQEG